MTPASLIAAGLMVFAFPDEVRVDYGTVRFGAERPEPRGRTEGLRFRICDVAREGDRFRVAGFRHADNRKSVEIWTALTADGVVFTEPLLLYRLPAPQRSWLAGDLALTGGNQALLLICEMGNPPTAGHLFHVFAGNLDGSGWEKRNQEPVYRGQDAFRLVWDERNQRLVNYQTTYQKWPKRYPDNMGDSVRRVLHIRTSPDGLVWTPGGSFGVDGPHLPEDQLIQPDELDPPETEFYKLQPVPFGDFWAGCAFRYISQPGGLPNPKGLPHGPFLDCEWWVSRDGLGWQRPFRETTDFTGIGHNLPYFLHPPIAVDNEWRFTSSGQVHAWRPDRLFYLEAKANTEITTAPFQPTGRPLALHASFTSVRLDRQTFFQQGYLMAELRTADDQPIPGFEKEKCRFLPSAETVLPLAWGDQPLPAGPLRLKLYLRDLRLYSLAH